MNFICLNGSCPSGDPFALSQDFYNLYFDFGIQFIKYNSFSVSLNAGYNTYIFPNRIFYYARSYLVLYQVTGLVAINPNGTSRMTDYLVYGTPYNYFNSDLVKLDPTGSTNQTFLVQLVTNEVSSKF